METNSKQYEKHSFKSFLDKYHVLIPMVQRDYAQGRTTEDVNRVRNRFLEAIEGYLTQPGPNYEVMKLDFVYGETEKIWSKIYVDKLESFVVTPLDGQQRLTTLYLLHWYAAKKENIAPVDYSFLKNFTYDIRPSSRDFCNHLMDFTPSMNESIKMQLIDQNWFMGAWLNDPTILSMLVMLDAIREKFSNISNLWKILTGAEERIVFYFLPLSDNGFSDELYIKMNSRGKKLTAFEHFKAEYEDLYERDSEDAMTINHKFDVEWADILFPYRDNEGIVDKEFMRYFFYVSHILCYLQSVEKSNDEFELIKTLYNDSPNADENKIYLEKAFDCWHSVMVEYNSIDEFFNRFLSNASYEVGKVATYKALTEYRGSQNFFHACVKLYQVNNNFSYSDFLFLYGIITYLINKNDITECDFIIRLRVLRNLIWNSNSGEIRGDADFMKDLLNEVSTLILTGNINKELRHRFNGFQEEEEVEKQNKKKDMSIDELNNLYMFEDHPLIYGYVSGLRYENLNLVETFYSVFEKANYNMIHQAMISIDDYRQKDYNRYYMGNSNRSTWTQLLHKSRNRDNFEKTMNVLCDLLNRVKNGKSIESIIQSYISKQEIENKFQWRYYFAKYPEMLRGADGELTWHDNNNYVCVALNKHQFNGQHWNPYLNVIFNRLSEKLSEKYKEPVLSLGNYGEKLGILHPVSSVASVGYGFIYFSQENSETWTIKQDIDGVDEIDRIKFAIEKISALVQHHYHIQLQLNNLTT